MTPRSRWLLCTLLGGVIVAGAGIYWLGDSGSESEAPAASNSGTQGALACTKAAAKDAIVGSEFEGAVRELGVVRDEPLFGGSGYLVTEVFCRDLTADDADEMVARLDCCAGNAPTPWAILSAEQGAWRPVFYRTGIQVSLTVQRGALVETSPAYPAGVPTCCPTTGRTSRISWSGSAFTVRSKDASANRTIRIGRRVGVTRLGGFRVRDESPVDAAREFGPPSYVGPNRELCVVEWRDLGLLIDFASLGGVDACSADGRVGSIALADEQAAQAGWKTNRGVKVGMPVREVRERYPHAESEPIPGLGDVLVLIEGRSLVGVPAASPLLSARIADGAVDELQMSVGAAGE